MDNYKRTNEILAEFRKMIEDDAELAAAVHKSGKLKSIRNFLQVSLWGMYEAGQLSQTEKAKVFYLVPAKARRKAMKKYKKHLAQERKMRALERKNSGDWYLKEVYDAKIK